MRPFLAWSISLDSTFNAKGFIKDNSYLAGEELAYIWPESVVVAGGDVTIQGEYEREEDQEPHQPNNNKQQHPLCKDSLLLVYIKPVDKSLNKVKTKLLRFTEHRGKTHVFSANKVLKLFCLTKHPVNACWA